MIAKQQVTSKGATNSMRPVIVIPSTGTKPTAAEMQAWNALLVRVIAQAIAKAKVKSA